MSQNESKERKKKKNKKTKGLFGGTVPPQKILFGGTLSEQKSCNTCKRYKYLVLLVWSVSPGIILETKRARLHKAKRCCKCIGQNCSLELMAYLKGSVKMKRRCTFLPTQSVTAHSIDKTNVHVITFFSKDSMLTFLLLTCHFSTHHTTGVALTLIPAPNFPTEVPVAECTDAVPVLLSLIHISEPTRPY